MSDADVLILVAIKGSPILAREVPRLARLAEMTPYELRKALGRLVKGRHLDRSRRRIGGRTIVTYDIPPRLGTGWPLGLIEIAEGIVSGSVREGAESWLEVLEKRLAQVRPSKPRGLSIYQRLRNPEV